MKKLFICGLTIFVVCFVLACLFWFSFEQQDNKTNEVSQNYHDDEIEDINVATKNAAVKVRQGEKFNITYKGSKDVNIKRHADKVNVTEKNNNEDHYGLNFNPFKNIHSTVYITVPKQASANLDMELHSQFIQLDQLRLGDVKVYTEHGNSEGFKVKNSTIKNLTYQSDFSSVAISDSKIKQGNLKTQNKIEVTRSLLKDTILLTEDSNIMLADMKSNTDVKASTNEGNINISYAQKPQDTLLKLNPLKGKSHVNNPYFQHNKVGNGQNIIELYTNQGNIYID